jgi:hypothetical protein
MPASEPRSAAPRSTRAAVGFAGQRVGCNAQDAATTAGSGGGPPLSFTGQLDAAQRQALYGALSRAAILSVAPSTRPIGDDEQPIAVELDGAGEHFALLLWADDARDNPHFSEPTAALYPLLDQLSGHQIQLRP